MYRALSSHGRRARRFSRGQAGFSTIELVVAVFVLTTGVAATVGTFDTARRLTTISERKEAATHVAEREIEKVQSLSYGSIALSAAPQHSSDANDPRLYVTDGDPPRYQWNQKPGAVVTTEPLVVSGGGAVSAGPSEWTDGRLKGQVHRFVTWVDDPECGPTPNTLCPGSEDFKRVTIAVTVEGQDSLAKPLVVSSLATDPDAKPEGAVADGELNPLEDPSTKCRDAGGNLVDCVAGLGSGSGRTWFLYDTPATSDTRQPIAGGHPTHPTVASSGTCTEETTTGCPVPDLLGDEPPPTEEPLPPLYDYSNELGGGSYPGGRAVRRDAECTEAPTTSDNTKGALWVTAPLGSATTLTGDGGLSVYTQTLGGVAAAVTLCAAVYDVPGSISNLVATPATEIGRVSYGLSSWPKTATPLSFTFDFRGSQGDVAVASGHRIGVRLWATASSGADVALVYDHPRYASSVQLNATGS